MKKLIEYIVEKKLSDNEKYINDCINLYTENHHYSKFIDVNNLPEKINEDILNDLAGIMNLLSYHILKDDSLYEFIVKKYFGKILAKAHIKRTEENLHEIWTKYNDDFIKMFQDALKEREENHKKYPDYYKNDK